MTPIAREFTATWEPITAHLQPTPWSKVARIALDIISIVIFPIGIIRFIAKKLILPASLIPLSDIQQHAEYFEMERPWPVHFSKSSHLITTPDGAKLNATLFSHNKADETSPTVIYFQPNGTIHKSIVSPHLWLLQHPTPFHLVTFDYRGIGAHFDYTTDFIIDGATMLQWVRKEIKTPDNKIHFYGYSLGGAFAIYTQALDPALTGQIVNDRSFPSLEDLIASLLGCVSHIIVPIIKFLNLDINPLAECDKLQGNMLIVYHPEDELMKGAHLANQAVAAKRYAISQNTPNNHCCSLTLDQQKTVLEFLFMDTLNQGRGRRDAQNGERFPQYAHQKTE